MIRIGSFCLLMLTAGSAVADDRLICGGDTGDEAQIAACTRLIAAGGRRGSWFYANRSIILVNRGDGYAGIGDDDRAIADYSEAIRLDPKESSAYNNRGKTYNHIGDYDRAVADFSEAIRLDPAYAPSYSNLGNAYRNRGNYDRAIAEYDEAIRIDPENASAYNSRGDAYGRKGDHDRAITDFSQAIRLDAKYAAAYDNRGIAWMEKGEYDRAIADLDQAIRLNPADAGSYNNRGVVWTQSGEYDRAIADFDEAVRFAPKSVNAYASRGKAWRLKGDLDRALADQNQAVELGPTASLAYVDRGDTFRYKGEFDRAIADYERALRYAPGYIPALTGLGLSYEKKGDLATARVKFEQASASRQPERFVDLPKSALETARARLAALDSGAAQPSIPAALSKATSPGSIPTPAISAPTVAPAAVKATVAKQGRRVALVIGNSAYKNVSILANPRKDAEAIAASLRNVGFDQVTLANDVSREKLIDSLRAFADATEKADWAMVYYAGHGMEVGGVNYLVPTDAKLAVDRDIQFEAVPLDQVLAAVDTARKLKLIVLDACRDNPFSPRRTAAPDAAAVSASTGGAKLISRSIGRGLAEVNVTGGTLVVFAAKNGQVALDGDGDNSPFAVAVLQRIATPGVEINKLFRLVRDDVMEATAGRQEPYTYGSLPGREDFFFVAK